MSAPEIQSEAFKSAALRSERIRIIGMMAVPAVMLLLLLVRALVSPSGAETQLLQRGAVLLLCLTAYEYLMYLVVNRVIRAEQTLPSWTWVLNLFIETLVPTIGLLLITNSAFMGPYRALVAPACLFYFVFIILSTLRLNPSLCRLTGLFSAGGYLAVMAYTYSQYPAGPGSSGFPIQIYLTYAALILLGGFAAGAVTVQIRTHVAAALREAETRRQLERIEHDLDIARSIQQGLLPSEPPRIDGFEIAGWNKPADETGGDYYDWQLLPDGRTAITLADVTGHGIGPALVTAVCRAYGRASIPSEAKLAAVMDRINGLLAEDLPPGKLITFVVGLLDPAKSQVQLLSAGHGPLLLYTAADDQVQNFAAHGIPFGVAPGIEYPPPQVVTMAPGDILLLITDGFFEWMDSTGEEFGLERLEVALRAARDLPAAEIISSLHAAVTEFAGDTEQDDDLTAVVLKRTRSDRGRVGS